MQLFGQNKFFSKNLLTNFYVKCKQSELVIVEYFDMKTNEGMTLKHETAVVGLVCFVAVKKLGIFFFPMQSLSLNL